MGQWYVANYINGACEEQWWKGTTVILVYTTSIRRVSWFMKEWTAVYEGLTEKSKSQSVE